MNLALISIVGKLMLHNTNLVVLVTRFIN